MDVEYFKRKPGEILICNLYQMIILRVESRRVGGGQVAELRQEHLGILQDPFQIPQMLEQAIVVE